MIKTQIADKQTGLILEGGGMRGLYTAGVLDFFLDKNIEFSSCYGVSAGAAHCCSYLSKQRERAFRASTDHLSNRNYASLYSLITTGDYFNSDFVYRKLPEELNPYDYEAFRRFDGKFYAVVTDCQSGKADYMQIQDMRTDMDVIRASCSLPFLSKKVMINGRAYLDGGVADSIPLRKSVEDGNQKNVVILTRDETYRKKPNKVGGLAKLLYGQNKEFVETLLNRHHTYNQTLAYIQEQVERDNAFVIQPRSEVKIGRLEKNPQVLRVLYEKGYQDASDSYADLIKFLKSE